MAELVTSPEDVAKNISTLRGYRNGNKSEKKFHHDLIKRGRLFVVSLIENEYAFAPSRFAGYLSNTKFNHERRQESDGKVTNPALTKLLGSPIDEKGDNQKLYRSIDKEFSDYCNKNGIIPANIPNPRKYWVTADVHSPKKFSKSKNGKKQDDAIDDIGIDHPEAQTYVGARYPRDSAVRKQVISRARGVCEYCNKPGFLVENGERYLECHHIIALAKDGADRLTNVIALCPNDHREAHFGKRRKKLEVEMIQKITKIIGSAK